MTKQAKKRSISTEQLMAKFGTPKADREDIEEVVFHLNRLRGPLGEKVLGAKIQHRMAAISQVLAQSEIMCHEGDEDPSKMQPIYSNGKVTFRCFHNPHHEFEIDV